MSDKYDNERTACAKERPKHLDEFLEEKRLTPWERAVLDRARKSSFYRHSSRSDEEKRKEELFWLKLGAFESNEVSKRRSKDQKSMRYEKYEKYEQERHDRLVRHKMLNDGMWAAARMKRRAERFGIHQDEEKDIIEADKPAGSPVERRSGLEEYADTMEKLERRRARFALEPRHDITYENKWKSECLGMGAADEEKMKARTRRFGAVGNMRDCRKGYIAGGRGKYRSRRSRRGSFVCDTDEGVKKMDEATEQITQEWDVPQDEEQQDLNLAEDSGRQDRNMTSDQGRQNWGRSGEKGKYCDMADEDVTQEWEAWTEQGVQEWERGGQSWEPCNGSPETGEAVTDKAGPTGVTCSERMGGGSSSKAGKTLQPWESRGQEW